MHKCTNLILAFHLLMNGHRQNCKKAPPHLLLLSYMFCENPLGRASSLPQRCKAADTHDAANRTQAEPPTSPSTA